MKIISLFLYLCLLISNEHDVIEREKRKAYIPLSWQIYTLDKLLIQVKHEFNAGNKDLYTKEALLARGKIKRRTTSYLNHTKFER